MASIDPVVESIRFDSDYGSLLINQYNPQWSMPFDDNLSGCLLFQSISFNESEYMADHVVDIEIIKNLGKGKGNEKISSDETDKNFLKTTYTINIRVTRTLDDVINDMDNKKLLYPIFSRLIRIKHHSFPVSKEYLGLHSEYFRSLFYSDFIEKNADVVIIEEINPNHFDLFLYHMNRVHCSFKSVETALLQLELADRFHAYNLLNAALSYLQKHMPKDISNVLVVADRLRMNKLVDFSLNSITDEGVLVSLGQRFTLSIHPDTTRRIFNRIWELRSSVRVSKMGGFVGDNLGEASGRGGIDRASGRGAFRGGHDRGSFRRGSGRDGNGGFGRRFGRGFGRGSNRGGGG